VRRRLGLTEIGGGGSNLAHPMPAPLSAVPLVRSHLLDERDVLGSFVRNARAAAATVHEVDGDRVPPELIHEIVARHGIRRAVLSAEPSSQVVGRLLVEAGVGTAPLTLDAAAEADLGVTGCVAAIATTGTVVVSTDAAGGRAASLLPPVHLCVVPARAVVPASSDVLRGLGAGTMPSNLVLVTGPSRSGDIEQIIALGVHGPLAVELVLLR
jgi:L-lactate dehydrogenase complex protein LldG